MGQKLEELKKKYLIESDCFDKIFLDEVELKMINSMKRRARNQYIKDTEIYQETETISQESNIYYRVKVWNVNNDEFSLIVQMENTKKISKIHSILSFFLTMWAIGVALMLVWFRFSVSSI